MCIYIYIYLVKHSFQATRRRGKRQPAQRLPLLPEPKAAPGPGRSRRERHGLGSVGAGGQDGQRGCAAGNAVLPQPRARRGRGRTPGFPGPRSWASGRGGTLCGRRLTDPPRGPARSGKENPHDTAFFWPWLSDCGEGRANPHRDSPGGAESLSFPSLRRDAVFPTCDCRWLMLSAPPLPPRSTWQCFG